VNHDAQAARYDGLVADETHPIRAALAPGGVAAFGDLMFESLSGRRRLFAKYAGDPSVAL